MTEENGGDASGFAELALAPELCRALFGLGYEEPTPIQRAAIPPLLEGRDLVGQAATGTGKTAAFALPVLQRILRRASGQRPLALILVPRASSRCRSPRRCTATGATWARVCCRSTAASRSAGSCGRSTAASTSWWRRPGVRSTTSARGTLNLSGLEIVVLDEADEMLDMGFAEDIEEILGKTPENRQTALFSATMPPRIDGMVRRHLQQPGAGRARPQGVGVSRRPAGAADRLHDAARAQARRPGARARPGDAGGRGRLLPDQGRGGPGHRDPERPGLPRRGAARRNGPAAARPGDGPAAQPAASTFSWPPTWPPAASTSTS